MGGLPTADPFGEAISEAEEAACLRWQHAPISELRQLMAAKQPPNRNEQQRRERLQAVLDTFGEPFSAAELIGISASRAACSHMGKGRPFSHLQEPFLVKLSLPLHLEQALEACPPVRSLLRSATVQGTPFDRLSVAVRQYGKQFGAAAEAAMWRDSICFAAYGMCAVRS